MEENGDRKARPQTEHPQLSQAIRCLARHLCWGRRSTRAAKALARTHESTAPNPRTAGRCFVRPSAGRRRRRDEDHSVGQGCQFDISILCMCNQEPRWAFSAASQEGRRAVSRCPVGKKGMEQMWMCSLRGISLSH